VCCFLGINLAAVQIMPGDSTSDKVEHCPQRDAAEKKTRTSACALGMFTLSMNMTSKGESPRERQAHAHAHAHEKKEKLNSKFVNEVMPFLTSRSSSPRFRMESTKGKMNMHFETNSNDQTCNADHRRIHPLPDP
jgi:hypothetical protein